MNTYLYLWYHLDKLFLEREMFHKYCKQNQITYLIFNKLCYKIRAVYEVMWKSMVEPDRSQMMIEHGACAFHAAYLRLQTYNQNT